MSEALPEDPALLRARIGELATALEKERQEKVQLVEANQQLKILVAQFRRMIYGRRSERVVDQPGQGKLAFAIEDEAPLPPPPHVGEAPDDEEEKGKDQRPRTRGVRRQRSDLPRVRTVIELPEDQRLCPCCNKPMQPISETVTEELDYQPAVLQVREIVRIKYACKAHEEAGVATPDLPARPIAKGVAAPSLIAQVVVSKYKDHLPLYRQNKIFERFGVDLPESTLGDWIKEAAGLLLLVVAAIRQSILRSCCINSDDTGILVQDSTQQGGSKKSFLWGYVGDRGEVVFDFTAGRTRDGPRTWLGDFRGYLQADAYSGYDAVFRDSNGGLVEVGCWAHARRKFFDAIETAKAPATDALNAIRELYAVERDAKELGLAPEQRMALRQERSKPILDQMLPWLQAQQSVFLPKSPMGKAIGYALNQWAALNRYLDDGRLAIDNNAAERALRPVAVGRKNWLFAGSAEGGKRAAVLYSIIGTCALQGVEPWAYLKDVLQRLANGEKPETLTPRLWKAGQPAVTAVAAS
jgi:transposase